MNRILTIMLLLALSAATAFSADQPVVNVTLSSHRVTKNASGVESITSAEAAKPGEIIEYLATYKNSGNAAAGRMQGILPVPDEMEFVPDSARPAGAHASSDGKNYSSIPLTRKVKLANGTIVNREVPVTEYRSLRWNLQDLAPGASVTVRARMKIKDNQKGPVVIKLDTVKNTDPKKSGGNK